MVNEREGSTIVQTSKGLFDVPSSAAATEYKKGYVMRKCCVEPNGKKSNIFKYNFTFKSLNHIKK